MRLLEEKAAEGKQWKRKYEILQQAQQRQQAQQQA
jgi:hypothetical protein